MGLSTRVKRLEQISGAKPAAPCPVCGAPAGWVPALRLVNNEGLDLGPTCAACNFPLMANGEAGSALPPESVHRRIVLARLPYGV